MPEKKLARDSEPAVPMTKFCAGTVPVKVTGVVAALTSPITLFAPTDARRSDNSVGVSVLSKIAIQTTLADTEFWPCTPPMFV